MLMSVMINAGFNPALSLSSARLPSAAVSTVMPLIVRELRRLISMVAESSTMRMVLFMWGSWEWGQ